MKIKEVIDIMGDFDVPVVLVSASDIPKGELPIYATSQGVCFEAEQTIWGISTDELPETRDIKRKLKWLDRTLKGNERELNRYLVVYELLTAKNKYKQKSETASMEQVKQYVNLLNETITSSLTFYGVSDMLDLIDTVKKDRVYREFAFHVTFEGCKKENRYKGVRLKPAYTYFGNLQYHEFMDIMRINIYYDYIEIYCMADKHKYEICPNNEKYEEQKIIAAMNYWRSYH